MRRISHNSNSGKAQRDMQGEFIKNTYKSRQRHSAKKYICGTRLMDSLAMPGFTPFSFALNELPLGYPFSLSRSNSNFTSWLSCCIGNFLCISKNHVTLGIFSLIFSYWLLFIILQLDHKLYEGTLKVPSLFYSSHGLSTELSP